ncbi:MAG: hypothetical protein R3E84_04790 [Pseudomonadales bacterium]
MPKRWPRRCGTGNYDLQYLIYLVALHRHLTFALPELTTIRPATLAGRSTCSCAAWTATVQTPACMSTIRRVDCILALDALLDGPGDQG